MKIARSIVNYENPNSFGNKFRQRRFEFFENEIKDLQRPLKILDIGGTELFWKNRGFANNPDYSIHLVNLFKEDTGSDNITSTVGNASDLSEYESKSFDIVFSNSVIEHLFEYSYQESMANEILRLGKSFFVQTPNKYFLIEPHFLFPLFQFFPRSVKLFLLTKTKLVKGRKYDQKWSESKVEEIKLLSKRQLKVLFNASDIYKEKFFGLNKSFVVYHVD